MLCIEFCQVFSVGIKKYFYSPISWQVLGTLDPGKYCECCNFLVVLSCPDTKTCKIVFIID